MNNLTKIFTILKEWRKELPNVDAISVILFDDELRLRVDFLAIQDTGVAGEARKAFFSVKYLYEQLESLVPFIQTDEYILNQIRDAYKKWEVGEE